MGLTSDLKQWVIKTIPGMNAKFEDLELQEKYVEKAQNCSFEEEPGAVTKRDPVTFYNSASMGTGAVTGLYRFYKSDGTIKFICIHGTSCYVGSDASGTWTSIRANLTTGKRASFVTYKDLCYVSNGFDNIFVYDGSSDNVTWELGACKAVLSTAAGGNLDASAAYYYAITMDDDAYVCGAVSNTVTTSTAAKQINLSNIPLGPVGTTNRKIYRTIGGGSTLYLIATLSDNTTTTYADNVADTTATPLPSVTDDVPKGSIIQMHRERLFISGDPTYPNKIYYSNVYLPHYIQQTTNLDYMDISPDDGDEIMGMPIQLGTMVCIKKNTIRKIHITSPVSGADPTTWYADDPVSWVGSPAQWSITQTPYGIIFLGWNHWYIYDGASVQPIIDEFDTDDILGASFTDVVGFWHKGLFLAAYSDKGLAAQYHNRIMRYNFIRQALSIDIWTSSSIAGANCFAAKSGDDESGELYYGDSKNGFVLKERESEDIYRLITKTECGAGTTSNTFVGGTETSPYIEIGAVSAATSIADNICIFWDSTASTPGTGWTEVTGYDNYFIKISATAGTASSGSSHTHTITGTIPSFYADSTNSGDDNNNATVFHHTHSVSVTSGSTTGEPRHVKMRVFKAASNTATEFPIGAIVMWDQSTAPTGWTLVSHPGYYVKISSSSLGIEVASTHTHTFGGDTGQDTSSPVGVSDSGTECPMWKHVHAFSGTTDNAVLDTWELNYCSFYFIKKVGESDTWDGSDKYVYSVCLGTNTISGWTNCSATYEGMFLKFGSSVTTGSATAASHTHTIGNVVTGENTTYWGNTGYRAQCQKPHTHTITFDTTGSGTAGEPASLTFRLHKILLGKMKNWNTAMTSSSTAGTWTSPAQQINASTMGKMFWNESKSTADEILLYTRTGSSSTACTSASWSASGLTDPNGSTISSSANNWFQYKIEFTAVDTTASNPQVYFTNGYVVKYTYYRASTVAEDSVNFIYKIGLRNFDEPLVDKIFNKIGTVHQGSEGSFTITWTTENTTNNFTVNLTNYNRHWNSFFQDKALGKEIDFEISKNDLYDFKIKELKGFYSPQPLIM